MTKRDSTTIQRSYTFRFYPTSVQRQQLAMEFGHARWVWNTALAWRGYVYRHRGQSVSAVDFSGHLTKLKKTVAYGWLKEASATTLNQKLRDQDTAFKNFFAGRGEVSPLQKKSPRPRHPLST